MGEVYDGSGAVHNVIKRDAAFYARERQERIATNAQDMLEKLERYVDQYAEDYKRVRTLRTFKGRFHKAMSEVQRRDRPEIELYLYHRDAVLSLEQKLEKLHAKLDEIPSTAESAESLFKAIAKLDRLEEKRLRHVTAMENILETLTKEQIHREQLMAKIAADGAKLVQNAAQHEDKMEIARQVVEQPAANDLRQRLALKYNVTPDQVDAILTAKSAEVVQHDAG